MRVLGKVSNVLVEKLNIVNNSEACADSHWSVLRTSLLAADEEVAGYRENRNLIGFEVLIPVIRR